MGGLALGLGLGLAPPAPSQGAALPPGYSWVTSDGAPVTSAGLPVATDGYSLFAVTSS